MPAAYSFIPMIATADPEKVDRAFGAMALLGIVAVLLVIVLTSLTVLVVVRRSMRAKSQGRGEERPAPPDAWEEAGRRATAEERKR